MFYDEKNPSHVALYNQLFQDCMDVLADANADYDSPLLWRMDRDLVFVVDSLPRVSVYTYRSLENEVIRTHIDERDKRHQSSFVIALYHSAWLSLLLTVTAHVTKAYFIDSRS